MMRRLKMLMVAVVVGGAVATGVALAASSPSVVTGSHSGVTQSTAVLHGTVNPNGSDTTYFFQWGLTNGYGVDGHTHSAGKGAKPVSVQATAGGLLPGTLYHYRVVAFSKFGQAVGADHTFTTGGPPPPALATGPVAAVGTSSAVVTGVINPHGAKTSWAFQYGLTSTYSVQTAGGSVPAGNAPVTVAETIQGLASGTIFHYRIVAVHGSSVPQFGADQIFMTYPSPRPVPGVKAKTTPHRASHKPYVFTTSGTVTPPSTIPAQFACFGQVGIRFFHAGHRVAYRLVPVQPNCTFSGSTVFDHLLGPPRKRRPANVRVLIHFRGNGYLAPSDAHAETIRVG
jgi:hypothetical protein